MKAFLSLLKGLFTLILSFLMLITVGILTISLIIPNFIEKANLVLPAQITNIIPAQLIMNNLYDYRFIYLLLLIILGILLITLIISRSTRKSILALSVPFMTYGYILLYARSFTNIVTKDYTGEQLYHFEQMSQKLFVYTTNLGIKYLIIGGVFFLLFVVLIFQYLSDSYKEKKSNKSVVKK